MGGYKRIGDDQGPAQSAGKWHSCDKCVSGWKGRLCWMFASFRAKR